MTNNFPSLLLGIDEFTITILTDQKHLKTNWSATAEKWISEFLKQSDIEKIMNSHVEEMAYSKPQGYTKAYNLGLTDYYIAFAYHESNPDMGVCIRFSAKSWAIYQHLYTKHNKRKILFSEFFNKIAINIDATVRLTRIDLTADFYNYGVNLSDLYDNIKESSILIQNARKTGHCNH